MEKFLTSLINIDSTSGSENSAAVAPKEMSSYLNTILKGDFISARKEHHRLMPLFKNCFVESNPIPAKAGLAYLGLIENILRPPLYTSTDSAFKIMQNTINQLGIK